jgi:hypothetical protein
MIIPGVNYKSIEFLKICIFFAKKDRAGSPPDLSATALEKPFDYFIDIN